MEDVIDYLKRRPSRAGLGRLTFTARCLAEIAEAKASRQQAVIVRSLVDRIVRSAERHKSGVQNVKAKAGLAAIFAIGAGFSDADWFAGTLQQLRAKNSKGLRALAWQLELALKGREERQRFALSGLQHPEEGIRVSAIYWLERELPGRSLLIEHLIKMATEDRISKVRQAALSSLSRLCPGSAEVLTAIGSRIQEESAFTHVRWLIRHVATQWGNSSNGLALLLVLAAEMPAARGEYDYSEVHSIAAQVISEYWQHDTRLSGQLREAALEARDQLVRRAASWALGASFPADRAVFAELESTAVSSSNPLLRQRALISIGRAWPRQSFAIQLLCDRSAADKSPDVRASAATALTHVVEQRKPRYRVPTDQSTIDPRVIPALTKLVSEEDTLSVQASALLALRELAAWKEFIEYGLKSSTPAVRCFAIVAACRSPKAASIMQRLDATVPATTLSAALEDFSNMIFSLSPAREFIGRYSISDPDPDVRECANACFGELRFPRPPDESASTES
jgi:hypothetical protein